MSERVQELLDLHKTFNSVEEMLRCYYRNLAMIEMAVEYKVNIHGENIDKEFMATLKELHKTMYSDCRAMEDAL
jgi:hypothetical protein